MSTERFVSLPLITVNYIYNDLLLIVECVECVEWSCGVVDVEVVCRSQWCHRDSTFDVRHSTSFQVYGLISQEPYIYKSVTTETKSIKSLTSVSDKLWYNLYVGLTEQATCISCSHLVVEGHVVWYIRPCCLMRDNIYCRRIRRGVYAMHHTYYIDPSLSHHHHCHSYILVISHSYISLLMSLACHNVS